jgi:hypothetical protein
VIRCVGPQDTQHVLDLGSALELMANAVRRRGVDFRAEPVPTGRRPDEHRRYARNGRPHGIVGHVLADAGAGIRSLEGLPAIGVETLYLDGRLPLRVTLGAVAVLRAAQQDEDDGRCWGDALRHARTVAARFVELVPDAVLAVCDRR